MANRPSQIPVDVYCLRLTCGPALWCRRMVATHGKVDQCDTAPQAVLSGAAFAQQKSVLKLCFSGKHQFSNNACIKDPSTTSVAHIPLSPAPTRPDRKSTRLNSSHVKNSYAVFCLKKK